MARRWYDYDARESFQSQGVNDAWWVKHQSVGRENSDISPYLIANEWICGNIAQILRLPVPPFALMRSGPTGKGMFASLKFGSRKATPNDAMPDRCYAKMPEVCAGILIFDIFIANADRHTGNIKVDDALDPKQLDLFDHDRALFGWVKDDGVQRLTDLWDRLGAAGGSVSGGNRHCFIDVVDKADYFHDWISRISQIPDYFIDEICNDVKRVPLSDLEADTAKNFLQYRKRNLVKIINNCRAEFTKIAAWGLFS